MIAKRKIDPKEYDLSLLDDEQLRTLKRLLLEEGLYLLDDNTNPNYRFLFEAVNGQKFEIVDRRRELKEGFAGCVLEGSSRSGKTWAGIDLIIWLCTMRHANDGCTINIVRKTYNEFKGTLYDDFKRRLDEFGIPHQFDRAQEVKLLRIGASKIKFLGADKVGKFQGAGSDYCFFNEIINIDQDIFDQLTMRCRRFWWADYNPSVTSHWLYDAVLKDPQIGFLKTDFRCNQHISFLERKKILGYEPWKPGSYKVKGDVIYYRGKEVSETHQPPPHPINVQAGTADEFNWKVYGLGLRGAMKGLLFSRIYPIKKFPEGLAWTYGLDFGFVADPSAFVKFAIDEKRKAIYAQLMHYAPTETAEQLDDVLQDLGIEKSSVITCDSSDKFVSERKGVIEMHKDLRKRKWINLKKVSKTRSIMYWLTKMKDFKIYLLDDSDQADGLYHFAKKEQENYRLREVHGIAINQPIDDFNHFWDALRYAFMAFFTPGGKYKQDKSHRKKGVNY